MRHFMLEIMDWNFWNNFLHKTSNYVCEKAVEIFRKEKFNPLGIDLRLVKRKILPYPVI